MLTEYLMQSVARKPIMVCSICGELIYENDSYYVIEEQNVCECCINAFRRIAEGE